MKVIFTILSLFISLMALDEVEIQKQSILSNNIWLKTYTNYKNYNTVSGNIYKVEQEIEKNKSNFTKIQELNSKLNIYKSKLNLYEKNNNFDNLLKEYKFEIVNISIYDYLFGDSLKELKKKNIKYMALKKEFYNALLYLQDSYNENIKLDLKNKKIKLLQEEVEYFSQYAENIEKMQQSLFESKDELNKKYSEYKNEVFVKHLTTLVIILVSYIIYKLLLFVFFYILRHKDDVELEISYRKILSLFFVLFIIVFIVIRYINDFIYIVTFLGVIAAALTLATREIILNIAGAIYIFFSNVIRVGDRVMVQFETKHTIGDVINISLIKIKLNEVSDYNNIKEIKNVGRTIYIPNSYIFTKVFYNYSLKKNGIVNDLIEFDFDINNDFDDIEKITKEVFDTFALPFTISYALNSSKNGITAVISYQINYKIVSQKRGEISIVLLKNYTDDESIKLKSSTKSNKKEDE